MYRLTVYVNAASRITELPLLACTNQ